MTVRLSEGGMRLCAHWTVIGFHSFTAANFEKWFWVFLTDTECPVFRGSETSPRGLAVTHPSWSCSGRLLLIFSVSLLSLVWGVDQESGQRAPALVTWGPSADGHWEEESRRHGACQARIGMLSCRAFWRKWKAGKRSSWILCAKKNTTNKGRHRGDRSTNTYGN